MDSKCNLLLAWAISKLFLITDGEGILEV